MDPDLDEFVARALERVVGRASLDELEADLWCDARGALHEGAVDLDGDVVARITCRDETLEGQGGQLDALVLRLDHVDGRGVDVVVPYTCETPGRLDLGDRLVRPRRRRGR